MRTWAKILGLAALVSGVVSFTHFGSDFAGGGLKPLSAVLFGAAFISWVFAPEYAKYDKEHKRHINDEAPMTNDERNLNDKARNPADSSFELRH
jgi:hypothetical protein